MKFTAAALLVASVSAECQKGIKMEMFKEKTCKEAFEPPAGANMEVKHEVSEAELKEMNKECSVINAGDAAYWKAKENFEAKSIKVTCDTKTISSTVYADEGCKGDDKSMAVTWGECTELKMGETSVFVKVTGAMALQAAAAAALAFVGSQF